MRPIKYAHGWTRRYFLEKVAKNVAATGVLLPLLGVVDRHGDLAKAYPAELLSIEGYTKGALRPGQELNAGNVDLVRELLDPIAYWQIKHDGRIVDLQETTTDINRMSPPPYNALTLKYRNDYVFGPGGNVWFKGHKPWRGGNPFPEPRTGLECAMGVTLSWGRYDTSSQPILQWSTDEAGNAPWLYKFFMGEFMTVGRWALDPKPYIPDKENDLRYVPIAVMYPSTFMGYSSLQIWSYDQRKFPKYWVYSPVLRRIEAQPTDQRFEPQLPGANTYASDAWHIGDPALTWGDYKIVSRGPLLASVQEHHYTNPDWLPKLCGGKTGTKYFRTTMQLVPETVAFDYKPVKYPRCPIAQKRTWIQVPTGLPLTTIYWDRGGKLWKQWESGAGWYQRTHGEPWPRHAPDEFWTWTHIHSFSYQSGTMTRLCPTPSIPGGIEFGLNQPNFFDAYCSMDALRQLGSGIS